MSKDDLKGYEYWRSLDELAETPQYKDFLYREFPDGASEMNDPMTRRKFLTLMGASIAFAGLAGCRRPIEKIVPYVAAPEEVIPGVPLYYATTMPFGNDAVGLLVETHEGRPTKIEGNPNHPSSMGKSNTFVQGSILGLYDPDRSKNPLNKGMEATWDKFVSFWREQLSIFKANRGAGLAVLAESYSSPTMSRLVEKFRRELPEAKWVVFDPISDENIYRGIKIATGKDLQPIYQFDKADVILSLDSDFLYLESDNIRNARGFAERRRVASENDSMNRLYQVESSFSPTGTMADHRLRLQSSRIGKFAAALALEMKNQGLSLGDGGLLSDYEPGNFDASWIHHAAADIMNARGKSLIIAGRNQAPEVHALVYAMNSALGNIGNTVLYVEPRDSGISDIESLASLSADMRDGKISTLVILGGNPAYNAPNDLNFKSALKNVGHTIHLSPYADETSLLTEWHVPEAHFLEYWGDARSIDGTASVIQPLIAPLFGGKSQLEMLNLVVAGDDARGYDIVRETWKPLLNDIDFEKEWRRVLNDGYLKESAFIAVIPPENSSEIWRHLKSRGLGGGSADEMEITFSASTTVYDGRFANNGWLQEMPNQLTKVCWDNTANISPSTARKLGINNRDVINVEYAGKNLELPAWILPGMADNLVQLTLGYGRQAVGRIGDGVGFDTYILRDSRSPYYGKGAKINRTGGRHDVSTTQDHGSMEGRPIVREATLEHYRKHPEFAREMVETPDLHALWGEHQYTEGYQWGMAIDLNVCTGCNACNIACYSENNIPIVGKEQVSKGREMAWIRVDRYFNGDLDNPDIVSQPVPCMHCENAPCEQVCPVNATVHDSEGLNVQVYNRCIGTRYCSNNCPYKVRRFNFFNYTSKTPEVLKMAMNPDVTVRSRGVMEKCTFCLQRINKARNTAKGEGRDIRDGEVISACAQACPTDAIVFGNINDPESRVSKVKRNNRNYAMLAEYNTRPRTTYLARLKNPNAAMQEDKNEI